MSNKKTKDIIFTQILFHIFIFIFLISNKDLISNKELISNKDLCLINLYLRIGEKFTKYRIN